MVDAAMDAVLGAVRAANGIGTGGAWLLPAVMLAVSVFQYDLVDPNKRPVNTRSLRKEYDFIVVGGGSAGAVVAARLSEVSSWSTLLLEAGGDETLESEIPAFSQKLQLTHMDWQYRTEPQENACLGMLEKRCRWPAGKVIGGTSTINWLYYVRGNKRDYNNWAALGNPGWNFTEVLPYFLKSENNWDFSGPYHSQNGPLSVQDLPWHSPLVEKLSDAYVELGLPKTDFNGEFQTGFMMAQKTLRNGSRCSTAKAYLRPIRHRRNLHIAFQTLVTKIVINEKTKRAVAVEFIRDGKKHILKARKEIIICAGAIRSPHLLMLSGVGPYEQLQNHGISVIQDTPGVGQNLQDHIGIGGITYLVNSTSMTMDEKSVESAESVVNFGAYGRGPLTDSGLSEVIAFAPSRATESEYPDLEIYVSPYSESSYLGKWEKKMKGLKEDIYTSLFRPLNGKNTYRVIASVLRPKSRGVISLASSDPMEYPNIDPKYLDHHHDVAKAVEGVRVGIALSRTAALQSLGAKLSVQALPTCRDFGFATEQYWKCAARQYTVSMHHYVGTCKMGPVTDPRAVVNSELRVYGVHGLRVADASIMPNIISGDTNAAAIMIGEKAADLIKSSWGRPAKEK